MTDLADWDPALAVAVARFVKLVEALAERIDTGEDQHVVGLEIALAQEGLIEDYVEALATKLKLTEPPSPEFREAAAFQAGTDSALEMVASLKIKTQRATRVLKMVPRKTRKGDA